MTTDLTQATAAELSALFAAKTVSPVDALSAILKRTEAVNPVINAYTRVDHGALAAARESEARWKAGAPLSPLDGVPVTIKELIRVKGWPTTLGSKLSDPAPSAEDAPVVSLLRDAGAVIFAHTASPEYGFKGVTDSPRFGITRNPWNLERTPGGSSGGAGAGVAAGLGPLAIGSDGGGSVRIPSAHCGLVGLKGTYGRVPAWPPSMHGDMGNTGPMTRTVRDAALLMNVIAKPDARDPYCLPADGVDYTAGLGNSLKGKRVGFILKYGDVYQDPAVAEKVTAAARRFEALGAVVEEAVCPFDIFETGRVWSVHWLSALQRMLQLVPEERHGEFDPGMLQQAKMGAAFTVQDLVNAQVSRREISHLWNLFFARYDLLISPVTNVPAWDVGQNAPTDAAGKPNVTWACTVVFNLTRHPAVSVPCGLSPDGVPIGLQIVAGHYKDAAVLDAAAAYLDAEPFGWPVLPN